MASIDGSVLWAKVPAYVRLVVVAYWLLSASLPVVIVWRLLLFPGCLSFLALVGRLTHDLANFLLPQMLDWKCVLADGMFAPLFPNSSLC